MELQTCSGHIGEWHVVLLNSFGHLMFRFRTWLSEEAVMFGPPFAETRFDSVGTIGDSMSGDCFEQSPIQVMSSHRISLTLHRDHRSEGFQRLKSAFKADRSRSNLMLRCGLSNHSSDKIVSLATCFLPASTLRSIVAFI
jgi:hypothetical protein